MKKVVIMHESGTKGADIIKRLTDWIKTWFHSVESRKEYNLSYQRFQKYYNLHKGILGSNCVFNIDSILNRLQTHLNAFVHYEFINVTTLGFKGDSIVESSNQSIKKGPYGVASRMQIDTSAMSQAKKVEYLSRRRESHNASAISRTPLWINSQIKDHLTPYASGLACSIWDRREQYHVRLQSHEETSIVFYVIHKGTLTDAKSSLVKVLSETEEKELTAPRFLRVRKVTVSNDGYTKCTCGLPSQYMMPCVHICSIISEEKYFTARLFGLRWWKSFNYYHGKHYGNDLVPNVSRSLERALSDERKNGWESDGSFRGVHIGNKDDIMNMYVSHSPNVETLEKDDIHFVCNCLYHYNQSIQAATDDDVVWCRHRERNRRRVQFGYQDHLDCIQICDDRLISDGVYDDDDDDFGDSGNNDDLTMGLGSQSVLSLSEKRANLHYNGSNIMFGDNEKDITSNQFDHPINESGLYSAFHDLKRAAKTSHQMKEAINEMQKLMIKFCGENSKEIMRSSETSLYGSVPTNEKLQKRKRGVIDV